MLRAYGRDRLRENGIYDAVASRHAQYYTELAQRAAAGMHSADERAWVERMLPDYDNLRAAFEHAMADSDVDTALAAGHVVARIRPSANRLRVGRLGGTCGRGGGPRPPAVRRRRRFRRTGCMESRRLRPGGGAGHARAGTLPWAGQRPRRLPGGRARRCGSVQGRCGTPRWRTTTARWRVHDATTTRFDWCGRCSTSRSVTPHCAGRRTVWRAAEESLRVAEETANPTARSMARYALGLVLKKSEPDRALTLFDEAAELAASVQNFWWHGIALMEGAATRAVHAIRRLRRVPHRGARPLGPGGGLEPAMAQPAIRRAVSGRVGAEEDAVALHHALVGAGRLSPLRAGSARQARRATNRGPERRRGVARARASLARIRARGCPARADGRHRTGRCRHLH